uniref:Uncharacterized protein n=1 Tax=Anguilla anguilla TaxID=7936 RepID=A0A0E9WLS0_ANGAN
MINSHQKIQLRNLFSNSKSSEIVMALKKTNFYTFLKCDTRLV